MVNLSQALMEKNLTKSVIWNLQIRSGLVAYYTCLVIGCYHCYQDLDNHSFIIVKAHSAAMWLCDVSVGVYTFTTCAHGSHAYSAGWSFAFMNDQCCLDQCRIYDTSLQQIERLLSVAERCDQDCVCVQAAAERYTAPKAAWSFVNGSADLQSGPFPEISLVIHKSISFLAVLLDSKGVRDTLIMLLNNSKTDSCETKYHMHLR